MRIVLGNSTTDAVDIVANNLLERIETRPSSVIGLATGNTMVPVYESWISKAKERSINHSKSFYFLLDDYLNVPANHPSTFKSFLHQHFFNPLNIHADQVAYIPTNLEPIERAIEHYEQSIKESGGIDIQLLGIGVNGHIGFNEPGSSLDSRTRKVKLSDETIQRNKSNFQGNMPTEALTMGIATILESKSIILLATGKSKAQAIKYLINHHDDPSCPATFLKRHPHFTLVLDPEAASNINLNI
jgi:glucosamine-6-phosphate deaminase